MRPKMISPAVRSPPMTEEIPNPNIEDLMPCPILPPKLARLKTPSAGWKKERTPHRIKARTAPPKNQLPRFTEAKKRFLATTQSTTPSTTTTPNPNPNNSRKPLHTSAPQATRRGANQYSNPITTISRINLHLLCLDLDAALVFALRLLINCHRNDDGMTTGASIQKFC